MIVDEFISNLATLDLLYIDVLCKMRTGNVDLYKNQCSFIVGLEVFVDILSVIFLYFHSLYFVLELQTYLYTLNCCFYLTGTLDCLEVLVASTHKSSEVKHLSLMSLYCM